MGDTIKDKWLTSVEDVLGTAGVFNTNNQGSSPPSCTTSGSSPGDVLPKHKSSPTSSAIESVQAALAALQAGQMSLNQVSFQYICNYHYLYAHYSFRLS